MRALATALAACALAVAIVLVGAPAQARPDHVRSLGKRVEERVDEATQPIVDMTMRLTACAPDKLFVYRPETQAAWDSFKVVTGQPRGGPWCSEPLVERVACHAVDVPLGVCR